MKENLHDSKNLECLICMDIFCEPITTICGHSFCKYCLISYLKINLKCPLCRKPILQNTQTLTKNITLDNLAREANPKAYELKHAMHKIKLNEITELSNNSNIQELVFPCLYLEEAYIFPSQIRKMIFDMKHFNQEETLNASATSDQLIVIMPKLPPDSQGNNDGNVVTACLCNILDLKKIIPKTNNHIEEDNNDSNNTNDNSKSTKIEVYFKGIKRFRIKEFVSEQNDDGKIISIAKGTLHISTYRFTTLTNNSSSEEEEQLCKIKLMDKTVYILDSYRKIYSHMSIGVQNLIRTKHLLPNTNFSKIESEIKLLEALECFAFFFVSLLSMKKEKKIEFYNCFSINKKIEYVYHVFYSNEKFFDNKSLGYEIFDLDYAGKGINSSFWSIGIILAVLFFFIAYKINDSYSGSRIRRG